MILTDYSTISKLIQDSFNYFRDFFEIPIGDDDFVVYSLLSLAQDICDKNVVK